MNKALFFFLLTFFQWSCHRDNRYDASGTLTETQVREFKQSIIRYVGDLPKRGNYDNRFDQRFEEHYQKQAELTRLDKYHASPDGYIYFEISRTAPSFKVKRVATGGRLKYDDKGTITEYEEVYRTWKMDEEELNRKTRLLFSKLVTGEDLTPYQTANSEEEYIEFPDQRVRYDKNQRRWTGNDLNLQAGS